jgi:uncharacterized integral membrane protein
MNIVILLLIIFATITVFSLQNAAPVALSFLVWKFQASLAIVVFLSVLIGMLVGAAFTWGILSWKKSTKGKSGTIKKHEDNGL